VKHSTIPQSEQHKFSYSIVVCTKNRPVEIQNFKRNLSVQLSENLREVIVVEGSSELVIDPPDILESIQSSEQIIWTQLKTTGGKPSALNCAMEYLDSNSQKYSAVVFLDDDIHFNLDQVEQGITFLHANNLCGLSPLVINESDRCVLNPLGSGWNTVTQREGKFTEYGENHWINQCNLRQNWITTDWLPGGASIYKWEKIQKLRFSPELENSKLGGYALGDDVDFSLRASNNGEIGCLTTIQVIHSSPLSANRDYLRIVQARARWKAFLLRKFPDKISLSKILLFELLRSVWHIINIRKYPRAHREIDIFLREFLRHLES
jgi:GT2 family glycosyltransferase